MDMLTSMTPGSHNVNEHSSRSHCIVTITLSYRNVRNETVASKMHLIDLAGSERVGKTAATGDRLTEAKVLSFVKSVNHSHDATQHINKSLSALGDVIAALAQAQGNGRSGRTPKHIPYRNSKLTHLLVDSLGGKAKVLMFVNVSPALYHLNESLCSLRFATRCRNVTLGPAKRNAAGDVEAMQREIASLRAQLAKATS